MGLSDSSLRQGGLLCLHFHLVVVARSLDVEHRIVIAVEF